ncbi:MAG: branched-chain amino acid ABC transporter permease [Deltaproteobacteria bacterium]|nr:branched-chain amino acid ABC transporter permease [Deltaproteobacteria bacterium]
MDMKRDHYEDIQLFSSGVVLFWFVLFIVCLVGFPFVAAHLRSNYWIYTANYLAIHVIVAVGLNLLVGYAGQISLGHAGFFALGAYGTVLLMLKLDLPFFVALPLAGIATAGFGFLLGLPALRLEGPYLAIATLGFGLTVTQVIGRWDLFGGRQGLHAPPLFIGSVNLKGDFDLYWLIVPLAVFLTIAARNLTKTKVGRAFIAIRDSEVAAQTMAVNVALYKTLAFAISAFYTGVAGGLFAFSLGFIEPQVFNLMLSILFLAMVVVGGLGSIFGSVAGGVLVAFLNLKLAAVQNLPAIGPVLVRLSETWFSISGLPNIQFVVYGLIMFLIIVFEPLGLFGFWIRTKIYWKTYPF